MSFIPRPQEIYKHFKGNLYQIVTIAQHSETGEQMVIYQALYGDYKVYARPLDMFVEPVDKVKYPNVLQEYRFELQGGPEGIRPRESMGVQGSQITSCEPVGAVSESAVQQNIAETQPVAAEQFVAPAEAEPELDPMLVEFLDADSYEEKLTILTALHHRITDDMITTMAVCCDVEVVKGELEERYESLRNCLLTLEHYECNRLR